MHCMMLKAKLHRVTVTQSELHYEGSCAIDDDLLEAAGIREYQQIDIYNVANGERFTTYAIRAQRGSGTISVNGAAARRAAPGDLLIIAAYAMYNENELERYKPSLIYVDGKNRMRRRGESMAVQAAQRQTAGNHEYEGANGLLATTT